MNLAKLNLDIFDSIPLLFPSAFLTLVMHALLFSSAFTFPHQGLAPRFHNTTDLHVDSLCLPKNFTGFQSNVNVTSREKLV